VPKCSCVGAARTRPAPTHPGQPVTERLYYDNPDQQEFDAVVADITTRDGRSVVVLDGTAFYPTSGGQPFDTGVLGNSPVVEVSEREDGSIEHIAEGTFTRGQQVHGRVDWTRRLDHMQQHTGQHVLSAAFDRLHGVRTESFHLGSAASTIDLAREVSADEIVRAEAEANRVVWDDRPVSIRYASAEEAAAMPLRKESARGGRLRLIDIADYDLSACGGTHVSRTGRVGVIAVSAWERFKGGTRVEFVCGGRALERFRRLRDAVAAGVKQLSVAPDELADAIARLQTDNKDLRRDLKRLQERLATVEAEALFDGVAAEAGLFVAARARDAYDAAGLRALASTSTAKAGRIAIVCSTARPLAVAIARSKDVSLDAGALLRALTQRFGGRGGGNAQLAQGGGIEASPDEVLAEARKLACKEERNTKNE
jgi:alanyl-tRNA synthetase